MFLCALLTFKSNIMGVIRDKCRIIASAQTVVFLFLSFSVFLTQAENFKNLSLEEGLSHPGVTSIAQDKLGRIWIGTREGVNIYDGIRITSFNAWFTDAQNKEKLWIGNRVHGIAFDSTGNGFLLIDNDIVKYNLRKERFSKFTSSNNIISICEDNGKILYLTNDSIFEKNADNDLILFRAKIDSHATPKKISATKDYFYIATRQGLYQYSRSNMRPRVLLKGENISNVFPAKNGTVYISTLYSGLFRMKTPGSVPEFISIPQSDTKGKKQGRECRDTDIDSKGRVWYGSFAGLFCYDPVTGMTQKVPILTKTKGIDLSSVTALYKDRHGNFWIGTYYGGAYCFNPDASDFYNFDYCAVSPIDKKPDAVTCIVRDREGNTWFGTEGIGVACVDSDWNIIRHFHKDSKVNPLRQNNIKALAYDSVTNRVFIGIHLGGTSVYDISRGKMTNLIDCEQKPSNKDIVRNFKIRDRKLYITTFDGIKYIDMDDPGLREKTIFPGHMVHYMDIAKNGDIYFIADDTATLYCMRDAGADGYTIEKILRFNKSTVSPTGIACLDSGLIIGTLGNGFFFLEGYRGKTRHLKLKSDDPWGNYIYSFVPAGDGSIYMLTGKYIQKYNPITGACSRKRFKQIFPQSGLVKGCGMLVMDNGDLMVGSVRGLTLLRGDRIFNTRDRSTRLFFSSLEYNDSTVTSSDSNGIIDNTLPLATKITIPSGKGIFKINLGIRDYSSSSDIPTVEYRLSGYDDNWRTTDTGVISYGNLKPGKYVLSARIKGTTPEISININITAPWYMSWIFWVLCILISIAAGVFIVVKVRDNVRLRKSLAKERKIRQEEAEKEKVDTSRLSYIPDVPEENRSEKEFLDKVKVYILNHISDTEFDILELCREIGMSRSLFFARFKEITGSTPNAMLLDTRMRYAAELLKKQKDLNITEVSEKVGYNNTPYFSACFRKRFGMSPTAYRKNSLNGSGYSEPTDLTDTDNNQQTD